MRHFKNNAVALLLVMLCGCTGVRTYHYDAFVFGAGGSAQSISSGPGDSEVCKLLFDPGLVYIGPFISIPTNALFFGVVAVNDGRLGKVIPLLEWKDEKGEQHCACNGPSPKFARQGKTREELLQSLVNLIKKTP